MKKGEITKGQKVEDRWYPEWGVGVIVDVLKTRIKVQFNKDDVDTYDYPHAKEFLRLVT